MLSTWALAQSLLGPLPGNHRADEEDSLLRLPGLHLRSPCPDLDNVGSPPPGSFLSDNNPLDKYAAKWG